MKKQHILSIIFAALLMQFFTVSAQIVTTITPKVRMFPSAGFSYLDDPGRFFNIQMINTGTEPKDIFFTIDLTCDFSATNESFYLHTRKEYQPQLPITIGSTPVSLNRTHFDQVVGNLNANAYETNVDRSQLVSNVFTLPEGQYRFCITPYQWTGHNDASPVQLGEPTCYVFSICYSGSAPEFTAPVNGYSASNLNNSNPANNLLGGENISSDNRSSDQYAVLPLARNVNFNWTGVVSNCLAANDFNYTLKIVEVYQNQNVQEAIRTNPTVATIDNKTKTFYQHDTVSNRHFRLQQGHVYAAQVQATLKGTMLSEVQLSNEGKSQVIAFVWGEGAVVQEQQASVSSSVSDNRTQVQKSICEPYFVAPAKDKETVTALTTRITSETAHVPADITGVAYVNDTDPYYQVTPSDTLNIRWMPVRSDSILAATYTVSLYEYVGGDVANSLNVNPIVTKQIDCTVPTADFAIDHTTLMELQQQWADTLEEGFKYVLRLQTEADFSYNEKTTYSITEFVHNMPTHRDSIVNRVQFATTSYESKVVFAWGIDSGALEAIEPPQFTYPVDLSQKRWNDDTWTELPDVAKRADFSFRWHAPGGLDYGDSFFYKLEVGNMPKGTTPDKVSTYFYTKDSLSVTDYIDSVLFDTLKVGSQYVARVTAWVKQAGDTMPRYNMLNSGKSHFATFKLVNPPAFEADLNNKLACFPKALDSVKKDTFYVKVDSLINNRIKLKMGDFPLVVQTCTYDSTKKAYSGDGYMIWHPLGVDVRLKVKFDTIRFNKDFQIFYGTAVSTATDSSTYLSSLMKDLDLDMEDWSDDDISSVVSELGSNSEIKDYYDKFKSYGEKIAKKFGGITGPLTKENVATEVLTFPLSITDEEITGSENVIFSINNMFFSPTTALMNMWAIFAAQSDNAYVPFLANNICMDQQGFLGNASKHIELFMGRDYEFELNDGHKMRFKKSTKFANAADGTVLIVDTCKLKWLMAEIEFDFNSNDLLAIASDGTPRKGTPVKASLLAKIQSWDNWIARIKMDPFAVADCDRFTFVPTGNGIFYDHSSTETPAEIKIPDSYFADAVAAALGKDKDKDSDKTSDKPADDSSTDKGGKGDSTDKGDSADKSSSSSKEDAEQKKKEEEKKKQKALADAKKKWQGFYWDEVKVLLSDEVSNTFVDADSVKKDSVVSYGYGFNGLIKDSVHYSYPGSRINFGVSGLIIDKEGFSADLFVRDIVKAETSKGGGWAFSLDTLDVRFQKNKYKYGLIKGKFGIPLFSGDFAYSCSIGSDSLEFSILAADTAMALDMWVASVDFDTKSSYFKIKKIYKEEKTRIDLTMNGKINVNFKEIGVPVNCSLAKFEGMGMRNYNLGKPDTTKASIENFEFTIGDWSFASPQKTIGGIPSDGNGQQVADDDDPIGKVSFGGFTFSLTKFDPIIGYEKKNLKIGFSVGGKIKFATEGTDLGAGCGFSVWGLVNPSDNFKVEKVDAKLESISFDTDFEVFKLKGELNFYDSKTNPSPTGQQDQGFGGSLSVTIMDKVSLSMSAGFGTSTTSTSSQFTWWFLNGACKFPGGIPLGTVSINGLSGGFAYNMKAKKSLTDPSYSAVNLLKVADKNTSSTTSVSSGMDFEPSKDSWVANAGISLVLTGAENTMNADGLLSLRIANKHFSGIFIDANAYVMTKMDKNATPGDGSNNDAPLVRAKAIMGYETTSEYDYFRLSIAVKADINLSKLLDGAVSTVLGSTLSGIHGGSSLLTNSNLTKQLNSLMGGKTGLTGHSESQRADAADASDQNGGIVKFNLQASVPIDFELKHYKKKVDSHKAGSTDWYFAIGKPKYAERVQLKAELDMVVCSAEAEFTFYMQTGNAFAYQMPPLSSDLQKFFGLEDDDKKMDTDDEEIKNTRKIKNTDWLTIDNGGGFCMGSSFHAKVSREMLLYYSVTADLGFDVALLDVNGLGCPGNPKIGKNDFYAIGRIYAALQGDVGLALNLGFWKGKISLFSAGIGALLQGGGPNPSFAYGLLRFKVSMLNGLLKFSTSVDFSLGDVCVPGAGDPLANVKLFQNVTPGFETEATARNNSNLQSPMQIGTIVSNMPWDREVYLADNDGKNARRFYFTLIEKNVKYQTRSTSSGSYSTASGVHALQYTASRDDANVIFFETQEGGFMEGCDNKLVLQARAFEWRKAVAKKNLKSINNGTGKDYPYYVTGSNKGTMKASATSGYDWFDPTFKEDGSDKVEVRKYQKDSTFYFKTKTLGYQLDDQVAYSWPYNGDRVFPKKEYVHTGSGSSAQPYALLYLMRRRDNLFDPAVLSNNGKVLKIYMLRYGGETGDVVECSYTYYPNGSVPYVKVKLPKSTYGAEAGPHKLKFLVMEKNAYQSAMAAAESAMQVTQKQAEVSSRISQSTYRKAEQAHNSNQASSSSRGKSGKTGRTTSTPRVLNIQNQQLEEIYSSKVNDGIDSMVYYRTKMKNNYKVASSIGDCVYEWTWFADFNYDTYAEYFAREFSTNYYAGDYEKGKTANYSTLSGTLSEAEISTASSYSTVKFNAYGGGYWLFLPYDPQDSKRYNTSCALPPRFFFALQNGGDAALARMHSDYFNHFIDMERDFKQTPLLEYRDGDDKGEVDFNDHFTQTVTDTYLKSELRRILRGGFVASTNTFDHIDLRIKGGTQFTQCAANGYHPTTVDVPCLLNFTSSQEIEPLDEKFFEMKYNAQLSIGNGDRYYKMTITDYATASIVSDINKFHSFMQQCQQHAQAYNRRGWEHKVEFFKDFYSNKYTNARFSPSGFPFDIPEIYIVTHYMTALENLWIGMKSPNYYKTADGTTLKFYDRDDMFVRPDKLQLKDRMWAQYWWSSEGQCLDYEGYGFDRDFYFHSNSYKYYNVTVNQDGKRKVSMTRPYMLGDWYTENKYETLGSSLRNKICIYYMTAEAPNFESNLLKIAQAVKKGSVQSSKIFYPNAVINPSNCYYTLPLKGTKMNTTLKKCGNIEVKGSDDAILFNHK